MRSDKKANAGIAEKMGILGAVGLVALIRAVLHSALHLWVARFVGARNVGNCSITEVTFYATGNQR